MCLTGERVKRGRAPLQEEAPQRDGKETHREAPQLSEQDGEEPHSEVGTPHSSVSEMGTSPRERGEEPL